MVSIAFSQKHMFSPMSFHTFKKKNVFRRWSLSLVDMRRMRESSTQLQKCQYGDRIKDLFALCVK